MLNLDTGLKQNQRLLQIGFLLFLLALLAGLVVSKFSVPRLGLSVHLLGLMQSTFLMVTGLIWPSLKLNTRISKIAAWLLVNGCLSAWIANLLAAVWGAGNTMLPLAAGQARGSTLQETIIKVGLRSAAVSLIIAVMLILWGLRSNAGNKVGE